VYVCPAGAVHAVAVTVVHPILNVFQITEIDVPYGFVTDPLLTVPYDSLFDAIVTEYSFISSLKFPVIAHHSATA
jgi:hypothetical protein